METKGITNARLEEQWDRIRREIVADINRIDKGTSFEESEEPAWWKHMMKVKEVTLMWPAKIFQMKQVGDE